jgi:hypothetical protein
MKKNNKHNNKNIYDPTEKKKKENCFPRFGIS